MNQVAMVGGGAMGGAIVEGILGGVPDTQVTVVEANDERADMWRRRGDVRVADLFEAVSDADVIFLAVKPDQITDVLRQAAESVNPSGVVVSIAAGVPVAVLERHAPVGGRGRQSHAEYAGAGWSRGRRPGGRHDLFGGATATGGPPSGSGLDGDRDG